MVYRLDGGNLRPLLKKAWRDAQRFRETAGLLVHCGPFLWLVEIRNTSRRPASFVLHGGEMAAVERASKRLGFTIAGTFHSHFMSPPTPGKSDIRGAFEGDLMLIIDAISSEICLWRISQGKARRVAHEILEFGHRRRKVAGARPRRSRPA